MFGSTAESRLYHLGLVAEGCSHLDIHVLHSGGLGFDPGPTRAQCCALSSSLGDPYASCRACRRFLGSWKSKKLGNCLRAPFAKIGRFYIPHDIAVGNYILGMLQASHTLVGSTAPAAAVTLCGTQIFHIGLIKHNIFVRFLLKIN